MFFPAAGRLPAVFSCAFRFERPAFETGFCRQNAGSDRDDPVVIVDGARAGLIFPIPFVVVAVFWRTLQLLFGNAGPVATKIGVIFKRLPREGIMIVPDTKKAAKAQNRVRDLAGSLTIMTRSIEPICVSSAPYTEVPSTLSLPIKLTVSLSSVAIRSSFESLIA